MREAGLHGAHGRLHGHFARRLVLPVLLVTEEEEAAELLAPRGQQSWRERGREMGEEKKCFRAVGFLGDKRFEVLAASGERLQGERVWGKKRSGNRSKFGLDIQQDKIRLGLD